MRAESQCEVDRFAVAHHTEWLRKFSPHTAQDDDLKLAPFDLIRAAEC